MVRAMIKPKVATKIKSVEAVKIVWWVKSTKVPKWDRKQKTSFQVKANVENTRVADVRKSLA